MNHCSYKQSIRSVSARVVSLAIALTPLVVFQRIAPAQASETITLSIGGTIERSISVESLALYAKTGEVSEELKPYMGYLDRLGPDAEAQIRALLTRRADLDVTAVSQFAYTPQGEYLLSKAGEVFRTGARLPGGKGLRGAMIISAADSTKGLTLLNVIENFPTPVLRVDLQQGLDISRQVSKTLEETQAALAVIEQLASQNAANDAVDAQLASGLLQQANQAAPFQVRKLSLQVKGSLKPVDLYLPESSVPFVATEINQRDLPAVIISHGLGGDRTSYAYLAKFLAARGFAVINVEHPGSDADQLTTLMTGRSNLAVPDSEFIARPVLISRVLDSLETMAKTEDKSLGRIDFNNVGVIGQSFGGYTALAVAGAPVNLARLKENCPPAFTVDLSVLLQCQAANLGAPEGLSAAELNFTDARIKAVIAINPMTKEIFGPESMAQIEVPVLMVAGSSDTVAPALLEQIVPFTWLRSAPEHYLLVMKGGTHFSTIGDSELDPDDLPLPESVIGPVPEVAEKYTQVMSWAFLNTYLKKDSSYQAFLTSDFTQQFSQPAMPIVIVPALTAEALAGQSTPENQPNR